MRRFMGIFLALTLPVLAGGLRATSLRVETAAPLSAEDADRDSAPADDQNPTGLREASLASRAATVAGPAVRASRLPIHAAAARCATPLVARPLVPDYVSPLRC